MKLLSNSELVIQSPEVIITKNNTYIGSEVIQNKNISSVGAFTYENKIRWFCIGIGALLFLFTISGGNRIVLVVSILLIIVGILLKTVHGVGIFTNSGRNRIIQSTNEEFVDSIISAYYDLFEKGSEEGRIVIYVKDQNLKFEGNIIGNNNIVGDSNTQIIGSGNSTNARGDNEQHN